MNLWLDVLLDVVLSPTLWLAVLLALVYSTLFTFWHGAGWRTWGRDALAGLAGFGVGQILGLLLDAHWLRIGDVQLLWGTLASVAALVLGRWLRGRRVA